MKSKLFSLILFGVLISSSVYSQSLCPNGIGTYVNELNVDINTETNEITFNLQCDPCTFEDRGRNCECRKDCASIEPSQEDYDEYRECIEDCRNNYGDDPVYEDYCLDGCEAGLHSAERVCFEDCGKVVPSTKTAQSFAFAFELWWTNGISESMSGDSDEFFLSQFQTGEPGTIIHNSNQDFMNQSISYCINYQVLIQYDDGTCCNFVGSQCFQKG